MKSPKNESSARLGSWECRTETREGDEVLLCENKHHTTLSAISNDKEVEIVVPLSQNIGGPALILTDKNNDGIFDNLSYDGLTADRTMARHMIDEDLDGMPDRVLDFKTRKSSVRLDDKWVTLDSVGKDANGLVIYKAEVDGVQKRVLVNHYPYQLVDLPSP